VDEYGVHPWSSLLIVVALSWQSWLSGIILSDDSVFKGQKWEASSRAKLAMILPRQPEASIRIVVDLK